MKYWISATAVLLALGTLPALAVEATFDRTLSVSSRVTLHVSTGSGSIRLTTGSDTQIHIIGRVRSSHGWGNAGGEERVRQIAANPPIEQTGGIVRVGGQMENVHNIAIDYEIQAPADAYLDASSGSGDVTDDGVGVNARLHTGSGSIRAKGLKDGFTVETGSGDIVAEQVGSGDVKAGTGSGSIDLKNISGGLRAETGSGDIKVTGQPKSGWKATTGSGSVEMWVNNSAFSVDATTGSGTIHTDHEIQVQGSLEKHHITGKISGGGPMVRIQTGSGDIRIH